MGGGLSGLAAAAWLAQAGHRVTVLEGASALGGRARSHAEAGFVLNQGPHALYAGGPATEVLEALGVRWSGRKAPTAGDALVRGQLARLPSGPASLLASGALSLPAKVEVGRLLAGLGRIDPEPLHDVTLEAWIDGLTSRPDTRRLLEALARLTTYANAPRTASAAVVVGQLQRAVRDGVYYLDGGWQALVDGLAEAAREAGATVRLGGRAVAVEEGGGACAVRTDDGERYAADAVLLCVSPGRAAQLTGEPSLERAAERARPVRAAALDLALDRLPSAAHTFVLGLDAPLYLSVHSATAQLAPEGGAVVHVAKYLHEGETRDDRRGARGELEALMDRAQPGWREHVVRARYLPCIKVSESVPAAADGGLRGRPDVDVAGRPGLLVAGDWVGPAGILADGCFASARRAAQAIAQRAGALRSLSAA